MEVHPIQTEAEFDALEPVWNSLADRLPVAFFSSFDYVRLAWESFHDPDDRLLVLVLSEGGVVQAIVPLCLVQRPTHSIPHRIVRFIAAWEGDRPVMLSACDGERAWLAVVDFLDRSFHGWDVLELMEQAPEGPSGRGWDFLQRSGITLDVDPDAVDYFIPIDRPWDDYLGLVHKNARRVWQQKVKRLHRERGDFTVERLVTPEQVDNGLARFLAIEQAGWKAGAGLGVCKDARHTDFYGALLRRLAPKDAARIYVLVSQGEDLAAGMMFLVRGVAYFRHTTYHPAFAEFSPGIVLHAEILKDVFNCGCCELDFLSLPACEGAQRHKEHWATGRRETVCVRAYRRWSRLMPLVVAQRVRRRMKKGAPAAVEVAGSARGSS